MENSAEIDPWSKMGNLAGNQSGEISQAGLAREAEWNSVMNDAPEFNENQFGEKTAPAPESPHEITAEQPTNGSPERDDNIADASAIINYGLNAAAREKGVEATIQAINNFVLVGDGDPIKQLFSDLGIDTSAEVKDVVEESRASKPQENTFRNDINAPTTTNRSYNGAINAIKEVKELVAEVQSSPAYANLRAEAVHAGKGIFEYAVSKFGVRDLTILFGALSEQKKNYDKVNSAPATEESAESLANSPEKNPSPKEGQIENQSSTSNSSPATDATAKVNSLL